ncbi:tyrosine-type recombinase/integrase [Chryseobacterium sp. 'Rf worker isolate 10']|uniref:tyrosine-type recombinase/integrase n=1 Tax=Chryseobacterium sp. 'Rf worker isolate 10' TaxID=2887348 RepID=UPI003D6F6B01
MSKEFVFTSKIAPYIESFLREKEQKGFLKRDGLKWIMLEFDKFYNEYNIRDSYIKQETIVEWKNSRSNDSERSLYIKISAWNQLAKYMCSLGVECYIPRLPKNGGKNRYLPYVFTHKEMEEIFSTSSQIKIWKKDPRIMVFVVPALIRLLYSTGIRISEALEIKNEDIDFEKRCIRIIGEKNNTERLSAINDSLLLVLKQYKEFRDCIRVENILLPNHHFFITQLGKKCCVNRIRDWFNEILKFLGIKQKTGGNPPRLHDLRHTAAVHALIKMVKNDIDIYCALPIISAFLGHVNVRSTEMYVRMTAEAFPELINMEKLAAQIFPTVESLNIESI